MKKALVISTVLFGLIGCSSSSETDKVIDETPLELLNGTWAIDCEIDSSTGTTSSSTIAVFDDGAATVDITTYSDTTCTTVSGMLATDDFTYTLGSVAGVDGTVAGISIANEFDATDASAPAFTVYAIESLVNLYFGDIDADPAKDGTTADKRPTTLKSVPLVFVKK